MTALLEGLRWRLVGPFRGGRVGAVAGHPTEPLTFFMGSTGGGVWKTVDAGQHWANVSDGHFRRASVGALAVSESDPQVLYAGMGESNLRNTVSHGDGVYRSTDSGRTWEHRGLEATRHIARVRIHPTDPETVYVAALGHAHGPNPERGVYRSRDGGRTWDLVLHANEDVGAVDLSMDPHNPRTLYAAMYRVRRVPWRLDSGGAGSGLWRSDDGGDTWKDLSRKPGLPDGLLGRIGVSASPAQPGRVWAIVEAKDGAVFRSDDHGEHWTRLCEKGDLRLRPFYFSHIFAHPTEPQTVWVLSLAAWRSTDGGASFDKVDVQHGDCHDIWFDPADPQRLILGDDGGAAVSLDGARTWSQLLNQPTAELYHVTADTRTPYRVYASQQDNSSLCLATHSEYGAITIRDMYTVGGGESGYIQVRPDNPDIVFATDYNGEITRYDRSTRGSTPIWVWPDWRRGGGAADERYRFNWTTPLLISPHDPGVLYQGGNLVFRSTDDGQTWDAISPDLSRNDPEKLTSSGGPITTDSVGAEYWCTVFTIAESPLRQGVLWAGTDDGRLHLSEDGGGEWREVTPPDLPEWSTISIVEASSHDAATAYVAAERHRLDDFRPMLYRTRDLGVTWEHIDAGLPEGEFCRVVREDTVRPGLLFCGTEAGVHVSFDAGATWAGCRGNLPVTPIHDLIVKDDDVVAATHGRSIWILTDLPALRQHSADPDPVRLYAPRPLVRWESRRLLEPVGKAGSGPQRALAWAFGLTMQTVESIPLPDRHDAEPRYLNAGQNAPGGVVVLYELDDPGDRELSLTFVDSDGAVIRTLRSKPGDEVPPRKPTPGKPRPPHPPRHRGLNRFEWDALHEPVAMVDVDPPEDTLMGELAAPVLPGSYRVVLRIGDVEREAAFEILRDPRSRSDDEADRARHAELMALCDRISEVNRAVNRVRQVKRRIGLLAPGAGGEEPDSAEPSHAEAEAEPDNPDLAVAAASVRSALTAVEDELSVARHKDRSAVGMLFEEPMRLDLRLGALAALLADGSGPVPRSAVDVARQLHGQVDAVIGRIEGLLLGPVAQLERRLRDDGRLALVPAPEPAAQPGPPAQPGADSQPEAAPPGTDHPA